MWKPFRYGSFITWTEALAGEVDRLITAVQKSLSRDIPGMIILNAEPGYGSSILVSHISAELTGSDPLLCGRQYSRELVYDCLFGKDSILRKAQDKGRLIVLDEIDSYSENIISLLCDTIDYSRSGKGSRFTGTILAINKSSGGIDIPARVKPAVIPAMVDRPLDARNFVDWFLKLYSSKEHANRLFPPKLDDSAKDLLIRYAFGNSPGRLSNIMKMIVFELEWKFVDSGMLLERFPDLGSPGLGSFVPEELKICNGFLEMGLPKAEVYRLIQFKLSGRKEKGRDNLSKWVLRRKETITEYADKVPALYEYMEKLRFSIPGAGHPDTKAKVRS